MTPTRRLAIIIAVGSAALLLAFIRVRLYRMGELTISDVNEVTRPRTVRRYRAGTDASFETCLIAATSAHPPLGLFDPDLSWKTAEPIVSALSGVGAFSRVADAGFSDAARLEPWARTVLECGSATTHECAAGVCALAPSGSGGLSPSKASRVALKVFAFQTQQRLTDGGADDASACLDAIAVSRFLALQGGWLGGNMGAYGLWLVAPGCTHVLTRAPVSARAAFLEGLRVVRADYPSCEVVFPVERAWREMDVFAPAMTQGQLDRVHPVVRAEVSRLRDDAEPQPFTRAYAAMLWPSRRPVYEEAARACAGPMARPALAAASARASVTPFSDFDAFPWSRSLERFLDGQRTLDLLESTALVADGRGPLPTVQATTDGGVVRLSVRLSTDGGLSVEVPSR